mmetsp:Transcript_2003/g.7158  ORF Transcript_2003/g.7158 Transcript_2003/m.7158 type:complete len:272 (-) Transcript_2003:102-917(-)
MSSPGPGAIDTVVVVPCYNEQGRLPAEELLSFAEAHGHVRFLFVNDGSGDGTAELLDSLAQRLPKQLGVLHLERNGGKAEAVRAGMLQALAGLDAAGPPSPALAIAFWDADLATPLYHVLDFEGVLRSRPDIHIVTGARVGLLGRHIKRSMKRHYVGRVFATLASLTLGLAMYDTQCGAKMFRASLELRAALAEPFRTRWVFDVELLARFISLCRCHPTLPPAQQIIFEYPLMEWEDVGGSKLKLSDVLMMAWGLCQVRYDYFWAKWPSSE